MEKRFYEEYARVQRDHWWFSGRRRIVEALLEHAVSPSPGRPREILDVGCGTGANLAALSRFGRVEGVESEPAAVELARQDGRWVVTLGSGAELPYDDGSFDVVTLLDVIEHVPDDRSLLGEARRVLRPGGTLLVTVPAYEWMWGNQDEISHHYRRYTRSRLGDSLAGAGLAPERLSYFNTVLFAPIAAVRLLRRLRPGGPEDRSDFELNRPGAMNAVLARAFALEAPLVARFDLPFGVSVAALASPR